MLLKQGHCYTDECVCNQQALTNFFGENQILSLVDIGFVRQWMQFM